jgi:hypothetical protein
MKMSERRNEEDRNPIEGQESDLKPDRADGSDVIGGSTGRAPGSDVVGSSSDLGPDTDTTSHESDTRGGEVY